jgi:Flp pilus assembly protein TadG
VRRHRQRGQTFIIAALAMTSMLGAVSMVIDAGIYFVLQRQLQTAADAAALAAIWYFPACDAADWSAAGCQPTNPDLPPTECTTPPNSTFGAPGPCTAAVNTVKANQSVALSLCAGPNLPAGTIPVQITAKPGPTLVVPQVGTYEVSLSCDAPHWFARVFPNVSLTMHINANASAALGWLGPNGQLVGGLTGTKLVGRLIL